MKRLMKACCIALFIAAPALAQAQPAQAPTQAVTGAQTDQRPTLEVAFVLDTTSSMAGLIEGAKQKIWSIASRMASGKPTPRIRVGLVAFRDVGDSYVTKRFDLSEDLDAVYANLKTLTADGGGDTPEHVGKGLGEAVKLLTWSENSKTAKMIFVVGDAPAQDYGDGFNAKTWAKAAIKKGIVVNTIRCGSDANTEREFVALAKLADGTFVSIGQEGGMVATATPFDAEIGKLNTAMAATAVIGGTVSAQAAGAVDNAAIAKMPSAAAADRLSFKRAKAETTGISTRGAIDLTAAPAKLAELKPEELPAELQALAPAARQDYVAKKAEAKKALEKELVGLSTKRDAWLKQNAKATADSFDERVFESVKTKAGDVGVKY